MRASKGYSKLAIPRKLATVIDVLAEGQRQAQERENFMVEKQEGFRCVLTGVWWQGEAGRLIRNEVSYVVG